MIEEYFSQLEGLLGDFPIIRSYELTKKVFNIHQGYITGTVTFENGHLLEFMEMVDVEQAGKVKYRYQYMDEARNLLFRYDNPPHHVKIDSFPHHKHLTYKVISSQEPGLRDVLFEISQCALN